MYLFPKKNTSAVNCAPVGYRDLFRVPLCTKNLRILSHSYLVISYKKPLFFM